LPVADGLPELREHCHAIQTAGPTHHAVHGDEGGSQKGNGNESECADEAVGRPATAAARRPRVRVQSRSSRIGSESVGWRVWLAVPDQSEDFQLENVSPTQGTDYVVLLA
jgi:hypothetical protein